MKRSPPSWLGGVACAAIAIAAAAMFLPRQSIWIDETSQLGGIAMGPIHVASWLMGHWTVTDVPADRTPPLSYWLQQAWAGIFGSNLVSLRWMGVACIGAAAMFVFAAARRAFGNAAGWAAGMLFALSPNVVNLAVEIRAYPLFILISAAAVWATVRERIAEPAQKDRWLGGVVALGIAAAYMHYFGLVMAGSLLGGIFTARWQAKERLKPAALAGVVVLVASAGLYPFIAASMKVGDPAAITSPHTKSARDIVRLGYRLIAHPAMTVQRWAVIAAFAGVILLLLAASKAVRRSTVTLALANSLGLGLFVTIAAAFAVRSFDATAPHYNAWMLPIVCVLLAKAMADNRWPARIGLALLLLADVVAVGNLALHGEQFSHGPCSRLATDIDRLGLSRVVIVIDGPDTHQSAGIYLPLRYFFGSRLEEWVWVAGSNEPCVREVHAVKDRTGKPLSETTVGDWLVVVQTRDMSADELARRIRTADSSPVMPAGPVETWLATRWREIDARDYLSLLGARVRVFRRT